MKTTKLTYWISTSLFAAFMAFTAIPDLLLEKEAVSFIGHLGYPPYFVFFIGVAKLLGSIAILVPKFVFIKEWAYAGLFFDLTAAVYSGVAAAGKFDPMMLTMLMWIVPGILSYYFWRKKTAL